MRADVARNDQRAGAVAARHSVRRGADCDHPVAFDHHVGGDEVAAGYRAQHGAAAEGEAFSLAHPDRPRAPSLGTAAMAATESFIGNRVRRIPSKA